MSTTRNQMDVLNAAQYSWEAIADEIDEIPSDMEGQLLAIRDSRVQRVVTVYLRIKPLLTVLSAFQAFPPNWRAALTLFMTTLDTVAATTIDPATGDFKAGKDLAIEEME